MKTEKKLFPLYTDLTQKKAVVIGGGKIAARRIKSLLGFIGELVVIAPDVQPEIRELAKSGELVWKQKRYEREDLYDADLALAATDDRAVNTASDQNKCDFHFPGIICHEGVVIGFNAAGRDHKKTRQMREKVEEFLNTPGGME